MLTKKMLFALRRKYRQTILDINQLDNVLEARDLCSSRHLKFGICNAVFECWREDIYGLMSDVNLGKRPYDCDSNEKIIEALQRRIDWINEKLKTEEYAN